MHAHAEPLAWKVRVYQSDEKGFERREKYVASCVATDRGNKECYISLLSGSFNPRMMDAVMTLAKNNGFDALIYERHGKTVRVLVK